MFQDHEGRARRALSSVCNESVSSSLVPDDVSYLAFFTRIVERLKGGAEKVRQLVEEKSRDLLARASSCVFSHLLRFDPDFDFEAMTAPVPEVILGALGNWVEDHVDDLIAEFTPVGGEDQLEVEEHGADDSDGDGASP